MLHVYWALGGRFGVSAAVPSPGGSQSFKPSAATTAAVALGLFVAAAVVAGSLGWLGQQIPGSIFRALVLMTGLVFLIRAIGDFKIVGFFKPPDESTFAYWDTRVYSPLCLFVAVASIAVAIRDV